jgi:Putative transposase/Transposase zinc-binding domain
MPAPEAGGSGIERLSFHELLTQFGPQYLDRFGSAMPARQREVLQRILRCRTPALGGELFGCPDCKEFHYRYHSCNDRHCPLCGATDADHWLEQQRQRLLLPVPYFLVTFTVPDPLRSWIRSHPQIGYEILFDASAQALQDLAANPKRLGAQLGMLGILHTWSRTLIFHPHVHYLVPGGGLSLDQRQWVASSPKFLFDEKPLALHFRTLFRQYLQKRVPEALDQLPAKIWRQKWGVDCAAAGSGENALAYLARYVFKTATGNRPLQVLASGQVLWPYRDSNTGQHKSIPLEPTELIRRFLQHVLPRSFCRVRLFGWLHPAGKIRGNRVRALLQQTPILTAQERQIWQQLQESPVDFEAQQHSPEAALSSHPLCCCCGQPMLRLGSWPPLPASWQPTRPRAP